MKKSFIRTAGIMLIVCSLNRVDAQDGVKKVTLSAWDGMAVAGYVNKGGFVNFGGPTVRFIKKPIAAGFGILPTMRIKEEKAAKDAPKNSAVTPTAGFGFTFVYKHPGLGLGYKF